jgi:NAD(P)-dependent dehydrogenase (short-subunit alcohol dehydrogenase family)
LTGRLKPRPFKARAAEFRAVVFIKPVSENKQFRGKVALITGASQGIGLAIAGALAAEGCNVVISGRKQSTLNRAARQLAKFGVQVLPQVCDVRDERAVAALPAAVKKTFGRLDILINNAGVANESLPVAKLPVEAWRQAIDTNLTGTFLVTKAALPLMKRGSVILNNLSVAAKTAFPNMAGYVAAKHGALGLTKTLREELRPKGIRVIALMLGAVDTDIWESFWSGAPRKKMMSPETVARAVVDALRLPDNSTVEELVIRPTVGAL